MGRCLTEASWTWTAPERIIALPPAPNPFEAMSQAAEVTDSQWESAVLESDVPVLVDFWAEWCAPCRAMGPYIDKLAQEYNGRLKVLKINTQDNTEVPARYGITAIPTYLLLKKGEVVKQMVGSQPYDALKKVVEAALN
jgi:thioredoxin 1